MTASKVQLQVDYTKVIQKLAQEIADLKIKVATLEAHIENSEALKE